MNNAILFSIATNSFALLWLAMVIVFFLPDHSRIRSVVLFIGGWLAPVALFIAFSFGVFSAADLEPTGSLTSLEGIVTKFSVPERLLNVWLEILGFILLVTHGIIRDSQRRGLPKLTVAPCLILSFISGAWGLLSYLLVLGIARLYGRGLKVTQPA